MGNKVSPAEKTVDIFIEDYLKILYQLDVDLKLFIDGKHKFYSNYKPRKNSTTHYKIYLDIINYSILSKRVVLNEYAVKIYFYNKPDKILYDDSPYGNNVELLMNIFENYYITLDRLFENMIETIKNHFLTDFTPLFVAKK